MYRQSVEAVTTHRMAIVEKTVPVGYSEWAARAKELIAKNKDQFLVSSGAVDGSAARTVKLGDRIFIVGTKHRDIDSRVEEWDGEADDGGELEGARTPAERADQVIWAERKPLHDHEKVEWEDEPQLTADQYVILFLFCLFSSPTTERWSHGDCNMYLTFLTRIHDLEQKIGAGLIEEVIQVAEGELELIQTMEKAKV